MAVPVRRSTGKTYPYATGGGDCHCPWRCSVAPASLRRTCAARRAASGGVGSPTDASGCGQAGCPLRPNSGSGHAARDRLVVRGAGAGPVAAARRSRAGVDCRRAGVSWSRNGVQAPRSTTGANVSRRQRDQAPVAATGRGLLQLEAAFGQLPGAAAAVERRRPAWLAARRREFCAAREVVAAARGPAASDARGRERTIADGWEALWSVVAASRLTLGPLDVNARNVLLDHTASPGGRRRWRATFLDVGAIGPDSPARRFVHYTFALGAWQPAGRCVRGLTPTVVRRWSCAAAAQWSGEPEIHLKQLDAYALLAELVLLGQVQAVLAGEQPDLAAAWAAPVERWRQVAPDGASAACHQWAGAYDPPRACRAQPAILCRVGKLLSAEVR